jgi:hypothetical protein
MKIVLVTQILPRMELDHLESWIQYNLNLGVDTIRLYNNGLVSIDYRYSGEPGPVWEKKPFACYHLGLSDNEVIKLINEIVSRYSEVHQIPWEFPLRAKGDSRHAGHLRALQDARAWAMDRNFDWLLHVDVDELVVPHTQDLPSYLCQVPLDVYRVVMRQKLMTCRWVDGASIPYRKLTQSYGEYAKKPKCLHRPHLTASLNVHDGGEPVEPGLKVYRPNVEELCFLHFRGTQIAPNCPDTQVYAEMEGAPTYYEDSHLRFLP